MTNVMRIDGRFMKVHRMDRGLHPFRRDRYFVPLKFGREASSAFDLFVCRFKLEVVPEIVKSFVARRPRATWLHRHASTANVGGGLPSGRYLVLGLLVRTPPGQFSFNLQLQ